MIHFFIPWDDGKCLGSSYNRYMEMIGEDDYGCFIDGDAMFLDTYFGKKLKEVIEANPQYGVFTCHTNRIGNPWQYHKLAPKTDDIRQHREFAKTLWGNNGVTVENCVDKWVMSGMLMLVSKRVWRKVGGFIENGRPIGVDNDFHKRLKKHGEPLGLMRGIYVYHWYRGGNSKNVGHLK